MARNGSSGSATTSTTRRSAEDRDRRGGLFLPLHAAVRLRRSEYCSLGGQIVEKFWVPLGTKDFASIIAKLPDDVDAIYLGLGGGDAVNFFNQYAQAGGKAKLVGGSILVDQTVLSSKGAAKRIAIGMPIGRPAGRRVGQCEMEGLGEALSGCRSRPISASPRPRSPAPPTTTTSTRCSRCSTRSRATSRDGHKKLRDGLAKLELDAPNGKIKLDGNRQAIGTNFITEVVETAERRSGQQGGQDRPGREADARPSRRSSSPSSACRAAPIRSARSRTTDDGLRDRRGEPAGAFAQAARGCVSAHRSVRGASRCRASIANRATLRNSKEKRTRGRAT